MGRILAGQTAFHKDTCVPAAYYSRHPGVSDAKMGWLDVLGKQTFAHSVGLFSKYREGVLISVRTQKRRAHTTTHDGMIKFVRVMHLGENAFTKTPGGVPIISQPLLYKALQQGEGYFGPLAYTKTRKCTQTPSLTTCTLSLLAGRVMAPVLPHRCSCTDRYGKAATTQDC